MTSLDHFVFLPTPRVIRGSAGRLRVADIRRIIFPADSGCAAFRLQAAVKEYARNDWSLVSGDAPRSPAGHAVLEVASNAGLEPQGYRLTILSTSLSLVAADVAGLFYGVMTLIQLLRQAGDILPVGVIEDHPDFPVRGVMLDISRDKVPTMETLFALVDRLVESKINHLELYTEHTFAYSRHRDVWAESSPMTGADIPKLDAYCRERFVELVPNQNSFGHMARWLTRPAYRDLAESPDGFDYPWGTRSSLPNSLNPADPRSLELVAGLYDELLPHFTSRMFNVGCDETWDLGQGKCKALCEQRGKGRVYLDFLLKIHELVVRHGRTMCFWGDIIIKYPELVAELPRDVIVLEWGYEADHPFADHAARFAASGIPFYVCPGTSSWNSIAGRTENGLANLQSAAESGLKQGAAGYLITDWGDNGHWQYLPVSYLGFAAGGAMAWNLAGNRERDWRKVLDVHVFQDSAGMMGGVACDLGNAYLKSGHPLANASVLFRLLNERPDWKVPEGVTPETLAQVKQTVEEIMGRIPHARITGSDAALVVAEFLNAGRMLTAGCERGTLLLDPLSDRSAFRNNLKAALSEHQRLWLARNRPGGLKDSMGNLEQRLEEYAS